MLQDHISGLNIGTVVENDTIFTFLKIENVAGWERLAGL